MELAVVLGGTSGVKANRNHTIVLIPVGAIVGSGLIYFGVKFFKSGERRVRGGAEQSKKQNQIKKFEGY